MGSLIASLVAKKAAGEIVGLLASKTQMGASAGALGGLWAVMPGVLAKEPNAIGQAALIVFGWLGALYGRWKVQPAKTGKKK